MEETHNNAKEKGADVAPFFILILPLHIHKYYL